MEMMTHADAFIQQYDIPLPDKSSQVIKTEPTQAQPSSLTEAQRRQYLSLMRNDPMTAMKYGSISAYSTLPSAQQHAQSRETSVRGAPRTNPPASGQSQPQYMPTLHQGIGKDAGKTVKNPLLSSLIAQNTVVGGLAADDPLNQLLSDDLSVIPAAHAAAGSVQARGERDYRETSTKSEDKGRKRSRNSHREDIPASRYSDGSSDRQDSEMLGSAALARLLRVNTLSCDEAIEIAFQVSAGTDAHITGHSRVADSVNTTDGRVDIAHRSRNYDEEVTERQRSRDERVSPSRISSSSSRASATQASSTSALSSDVKQEYESPKFTSSDAVRRDCQEKDEISIYDCTFGELMFLSEISSRGLRYLLEMVGGDVDVGRQYQKIYQEKRRPSGITLHTTRESHVIHGQPPTVPGREQDMSTVASRSVTGAAPSPRLTGASEATSAAADELLEAPPLLEE